MRLVDSILIYAAQPAYPFLKELLEQDDIAVSELTKLEVLGYRHLTAEAFRAEHNVGFYAGRLAITPKYLSSLIRDISGLSAPQWINDYIVVEAKTLLKSSDMNIKQIAEYLYFPNPSFFSKYFKQHTGVSPKEYRGG